ncbi:MAG TPA: two-component regulator propeller domain-containing protein [Pyrinomonadaceae bacterium]|jgi:signal transduction histidine kinase/ligand-binding sensor domain-containing protein
MKPKMRQTFRFFFSSLFFLMVFGGALPIARAERPPFKIYTTGEGLAHDSVNKIVRDSRGFLWFCTAEGLSRFDGSKFKNYTQDQGLPHRNVNDFLETRDGTYLVATSAGLTVFNPNGKAYRWNVLESKLEQDSDDPPLFQTFAPDIDIRPKKTILSLAQDRQGTIWAGTGFGLFRIDKINDTWQFREIEVEKEHSVNFPALLLDSHGDLLVGSGAGVYRALANGKFEKLDKYGAATIFEDREGRIWVGAGGDPIGLRIFERENGALKLSRIYTKKDGLPDDIFQFSGKQTSDGRIYVGLHKGLCEFLPDAAENEPKFRVLESSKVTSLAEDSSGDLWFGTELLGAWKLARSGFTSFTEKDGISETDDIRAIYINENSEIFIPTRPQKILHLVDGKFESVLPHGLTARSWGWHFLDFQAKDGEWWIPAIDGLRRYPKVDNFADLARTPPKKIYTRDDGLFSNEIFNLFEDSRGDIWISIIGNDNTLSRWERSTDKIFSYTSADGIPKSNGALSFAEDLYGNVWFGFYFGNLARYRDGKFQIFNAADGIPESLVGDILKDSSGRLWVGTSGRGLFRIDNPDEEKPVFKSISTANGLSSNQIICLVEDRFQRIYVGTGRGINRIDRGGNIRIFTQADGLPSNYITRCAADKKGFLWFVTRNTLVRFSPEIERSSASPPVFIDKIFVNGIPQKISALGETEVKPIELESDQRQIQIDFFALTFGAGENIRYQYRLDEQDWSAPTEQQTLNFDLAPGKHDLRLRAVRADGAASEKPAVINFIILPPVWQRRWFILIAALLITAFILILYRYRTANLRKINLALTEAHHAEEELRKSREERLAELEKVRSRIATDLHDDIGASLTQIAILSEVARAQGKKGNGASAEPLKKISRVSNELVGTMSDIVWSINPGKDHLSDLTQRMRRFASDVLSPKAIGLDFHAPDKAGEITLNTNLRREVFLIFKESINNILKHSSAAHVRIELEISGEYLKLEISDDGNGFDRRQPDLSEPADAFSAAGEAGGNGILSMKKRAKEMNGKLKIVSEIGKGTLVSLRLPLNKI